MKDPTCKNCIALTSGDCGQHNAPQNLKENKTIAYTTPLPKSTRGGVPFNQIPIMEENLSQNLVEEDWENGIESLCKYRLGGMDLYSTAELKHFISSQIKQAEERGQGDYKQFILNILDGVDIADKAMNNKGGGTLAIRYALNSRIITNQ